MPPSPFPPGPIFSRLGIGGGNEPGGGAEATQSSNRVPTQTGNKCTELKHVLKLNRRMLRNFGLFFGKIYLERKENFQRVEEIFRMPYETFSSLAV